MIDLPPFMDLPPGYIRDGSGLIKKMVLPGIAFPAIMIGSAKSVSPTTKTILLTSGSSFTVPSDWNSNQPGSGGFANKIECIASGATGGSGGSFNGAPGGKGGAYASITNFSASPGSSVSYQIGNAAGSTSQRHTFFGAATYASSPVAAESGYGGGRASQSIGTTKYSGGSGGAGSGENGGGGGSAARATANGSNGSNPNGASQSSVLWTDNSGGANNGLQARSGGGGTGGIGSFAGGTVGGSYGGGAGGGGPGEFTGGGDGGVGGPGIIAITYYPLI